MDHSMEESIVPIRLNTARSCVNRVYNYDSGVD